jgi:hypothetical protein
MAMLGVAVVKDALVLVMRRVLSPIQLWAFRMLSPLLAKTLSMKQGGRDRESGSTLFPPAPADGSLASVVSSCQSPIVS